MDVLLTIQEVEVRTMLRSGRLVGKVIDTVNMCFD